MIEVDALPIEPISDEVYSINQRDVNSYTHNYFKYPCKFIPEIPRWAIRKYAIPSKQNTIYDPFAGSGTTLLEAALCGHCAYGADIDDIAKLIISAKTTQLSLEKIELLDSYYQTIVDAAKSSCECVQPVIKNISHWFSKETIETIGRMLAAIESFIDEGIRNFFLVCIASIIKRVSYADDMSPKPYVSSKIKKNPPMALDEFARIYTKYKSSICELGMVAHLGDVTIVDGDARRCNLADNSMDLAISSPPYINAFDYARIMRLENLWLDKKSEELLLRHKREYIGTESVGKYDYYKYSSILSESEYLNDCIERIVQLDKMRATVVLKFFCDMQENLREIYRLLRQGGRYVLVIGNSTIRGAEVQSWQVLCDIATAMGYDFELHFSYVIKNPRIRIPRAGRGGIIKSDHILVLQKR